MDTCGSRGAEKVGDAREEWTAKEAGTAVVLAAEMTRPGHGQSQHLQRALTVNSKTDCLLCRADQVKYPGRLMSSEAPQCLLGPFWSACSVTPLTKTQSGTQDDRQESHFGDLQSVYKNIYIEDECACYTWNEWSANPKPKELLIEMGRHGDLLKKK